MRDDLRYAVQHAQDGTRTLTVFGEDKDGEPAASTLEMTREEAARLAESLTREAQ